ncbi:hypothetical protein SAMN06295943_3321 [Agreia sp. VKM Ac-1783]|nr:hypothetical protein SAMN06295943_3321 [Agreia sp. VKM Ac-1783]
MQWRAKWAQNWAEVKYCSDACRRRGVNETDKRLEAVIVSLTSERQDAPVTPEVVARTVAPDDWQSLYEPARRAARRLAHRGEVDIVQNGRAIDPGLVRRPFSIRAALRR